MPATDRPKKTTRPPQPLKSAANSTATTSKSSNKHSWATSKILTSTSAITAPSIDIHAFLITCVSGWSSYTEEEKLGIINSLPPAYRKHDLNANNELECPVSIDFVMADPFLKRAVGKFKSDVEEGYWDPGWQAKAKKVMQERREGVFDEYQRKHVEEMFGDEGGSQEGKKDDGGGGDSVMDGGQKGTAKQTGQDSEDELAVSSDGEWFDTKSKTKRKLMR